MPQSLYSHFVEPGKKWLIVNSILILLTLAQIGQAQQLGRTKQLGGAQNRLQQFDHLFKRADTFSAPRFYGITGTGASIYTGFSIGLYNTWYKQYDLTHFHLFNDWGEWEYVDKVGHFYTAWFQGYLVHSMMKWSGLNDEGAIWGGVIAGSLFQSTIEVMDGFSEKWGFSLTDIGANLAGTSLFALQQWHWNEQKIKIKYSSWPSQSYQYDHMVQGDQGSFMSLNDRAADLYGERFWLRVLKDYNHTTHWITFHPEDIVGDFGMPDWLNLAIGYSGENIFGGFGNSWVKNGEYFEVNDPAFRRYHQFYIAPDIDLDKIHTNSHFLKFVFRVINIVKLPTPAIEFNDLDGVRVIWHWFYF